MGTCPIRRSEMHFNFGYHFGFDIFSRPKDVQEFPFPYRQLVSSGSSQQEEGSTEDVPVFNLLSKRKAWGDLRRCYPTSKNDLTKNTRLYERLGSHAISRGN